MPLRRNKYVTIVVLLLSNLLNYVDRYTVAGVLPQLEAYFGIGSDKLGLLQTCFLGCYTLSSPVYGYIGDRYNRIHVIAAGKLLWVLAVLGSTFVQGDHYWIFFCCRGVVGIGEAAVSNIAPAIIADLFTGRSRTVWTAAYFLMIPIGR
ncbi:hypothetical protein L596_023126 [Steinernema carpocapsae]|uniref:Major facilitator superfamily (MFS) profile domain-containing protein n=1 Tax=Steinernema carpocapsae TaxID=34508 RepID=A0A4U5MCQ4_STECR|nr:hypothetical protein L596_023126 [Steinernema carpocapsae]